MKELIYWLMEKLLGKDILHAKVNIGVGAIIMLVAVAIWSAIDLHSLYWQWNDIKGQVRQTPAVTSNIVSQVVEAQFGTRIDRLQISQDLILKDLSTLQDDDKRESRKLDRITDYLFDKDGVKLDFNWSATNSAANVP
jgi:hypothetical protein